MVPNTYSKYLIATFVAYFAHNCKEIEARVYTLFLPVCVCWEWLFPFASFYMYIGFTATVEHVTKVEFKKKVGKTMHFQMTRFHTAHLHGIICFLDDVLQVFKSPPVVSSTAMVLRSMEKMSLGGREKKEGE